MTRRDQLALARRVQCPVLVINGTEDKVTVLADARELAIDPRLERRPRPMPRG